MFRAMRIAVVAAVAVAIAALPIVLDQCAESCEAHQHSVAASPPCHHVATPGAHVSPAPTVCGHDHSATAFAAAKSSTPSADAHSIVAVNAGVAVVPPKTPRAGVLPQSPPDSSQSLDRRSLPLRV